MSAAINPRVLIELIRGLDTEHESPHSYISVTRWSENGGSDDEELEALVRVLARERLGGFSLDAIGSSTLALIDSTGPT